MPLTPQQKTTITSILETLLTAVAQPPNRANSTKPTNASSSSSNPNPNASSSSIGGAGPVTGVGGTGIGTGRGRKRLLSGMFLMLLDKNDWKAYYDLIPEPRALHPIRDRLALPVTNPKAYSSPLEVYADLALVFWNATFYNEKDSQISRDAEVLKRLLDVEWGKYALAREGDGGETGTLPQPRSFSPPPGSAQKAYPEIEEERQREEREREKERERERLENEKQKKAAAKAASVEPPQVPAPVAAQAQAAVVAPVAAPVPVVPLPNPFAQPIEDEDSESDVDTTTDTESESDISDSDNDTNANANAISIAERESESQRLLEHMDKSIPKWPGFDEGEEGWLAEGDNKTYLHLLNTIKYHSIAATRLATVLDDIPDVIDIDGIASTSSLSLTIIETRINKSTYYLTPASFDRDMMRLFEKGRRWWGPSPTSSSLKRSAFTVGSGGSEEYGKVLILQRLYQALTAPWMPDRPLPSTSTLPSSTSVSAGAASSATSPSKSTTDGATSSSTKPTAEPTNVKSKLRSSHPKDANSSSNSKGKGKDVDEKEEYEEAPYDGPRYESKTNFASMGVGPGSLSLLLCDENEHEYEEGKVRNVDPLAWTSNARENDTTKGKSKKEEARVHLSSITYKGHTIRPGDWVHLSNGVAGPVPAPSSVPSNSAKGEGEGGAGSELGLGSASRPIVAQVWEIWRVLDAKAGEIQSSNVNGNDERDEVGVGKGPGEESAAQMYISALWFHRPSETYHSPQRVFWENEVFMGAHLATHPLPDILEPICVQFLEDHVRGRPRAPRPKINTHRIGGVSSTLPKSSTNGNVVPRTNARITNGVRSGAVGGTTWYPGWPLYVCDSMYRCRIGGRGKGSGASTSTSALPASTSNTTTTSGAAKPNPRPKPKFSRLRRKHLELYLFSPYSSTSSLSSSPPRARNIYAFERRIYPRRWPSPFILSLSPTNSNLASVSALGMEGIGPGGLVPDRPARIRARPSSTITVTGAASKPTSATNSSMKATKNRERDITGPTKGTLYTLGVGADGKKVPVPAVPASAVSSVPSVPPASTQVQQTQYGQYVPYGAQTQQYGQYGQYGIQYPQTQQYGQYGSSYQTALPSTSALPSTLPATGSTLGSTAPKIHRKGVDRTISVYAAATGSGTGGSAPNGASGAGAAQYDLEKLPKDTTRHFTRDPTTGSLLWFPSPPVNSPGRSITVNASVNPRIDTKGRGITNGLNGNAQGTKEGEGLPTALLGQKVSGNTPGPRYSLTYLHWRAMKTQAQMQSQSESQTGKRKRHLSEGISVDSAKEGLEVAPGTEGQSEGASRTKKNRVANEDIIDVDVDMDVTEEQQTRTTIIETLAGVLKNGL